MKSYTLGAIPSKTDNRDYSVCAIPRAYPTRFYLDMRSNYDQEHGTCVAQSVRGIYRQNFGKEFGTAFLYGGGRSHTMSGMYPNEAANFACKYGLAPLADDPTEQEVYGVISYYNSNRSRLETAAAPYSGGTWGRCYSINDIKAAITDGLPVMFCASISQWNPDSLHRYPCTEPKHGYHEMLIYGWDVVGGKEMAAVYNSWGSDWGNKGECYVSWEDVLRNNDVIVLTPPPKTEPENEEKNIVVRRTLRRGMEGADVQELQEKLISIGYRCNIRTANGTFGSRTEEAVKTYQTARGLEPDGIVGKNTWAALDADEEEQPLEPQEYEPTGLMADFIAYLKEQCANHSIYVWGAQGQTGSEITEEWIRKREKNSSYAERAIRYWMKQVAAGYGDVLSAYDCSGLGMYFIQNLHGLSKGDLSADNMRRLCTEIKRGELRAGDWVFRVNSGGAYHIGYVIDNDLNVIHAKGRDYGVIREALNGSGASYWNWYGRPTVFDNAPPEPEKERDLYLTSPMMRGDDVKALQQMLSSLGYNVGDIDGIFGQKTHDAVKTFQELANRLKTDGVCGADMRALLGLDRMEV